MKPTDHFAIVIYWILHMCTIYELSFMTLWVDFNTHYCTYLHTYIKYMYIPTSSPYFLMYHAYISCASAKHLHKTISGISYVNPKVSFIEFKCDWQLRLNKEAFRNNSVPCRLPQIVTVCIFWRFQHETFPQCLPIVVCNVK